MEPSAAMWNERFAATPHAYGTKPNAWLVACAPRLGPGSEILCLAEGQGRNALWLAAQGHCVTAVDASSVAMEQLRETATRGDWLIATQVADLRTWVPPVAAFDAVVLVFAHFLPDARPVVHAGAIQALRRGGRIILEAFSPEQRRLGLSSGGPRDTAMLYSADALRRDFAGLVINHLEEATVVLDEGSLHQGEARVTRLLAERAGAQQR